MKKHNSGDVTVTEQRRAELAKARRDRRKAKRAVLIQRAVRPLVLEIGKLRQQLKQLETQTAGAVNQTAQEVAVNDSKEV